MDDFNELNRVNTDSCAKRILLSQDLIMNKSSPDASKRLDFAKQSILSTLTEGLLSSSLKTIGTLIRHQLSTIRTLNKFCMGCLTVDPPKGLLKKLSILLVEIVRGTEPLLDLAHILCEQVHSLLTLWSSIEICQTSLDESKQYICPVEIDDCRGAFKSFSQLFHTLWDFSTESSNLMVYDFIEIGSNHMNDNLSVSSLHARVWNLVCLLLQSNPGCQNAFLDSILPIMVHEEECLPPNTPSLIDIFERIPLDLVHCPRDVDWSWYEVIDRVRSWNPKRKSGSGQVKDHQIKEICFIKFLEQFFTTVYPQELHLLTRNLNGKDKPLPMRSQIDRVSENLLRLRSTQSVQLTVALKDSGLVDAGMMMFVHVTQWSSPSKHFSSKILSQLSLLQLSHKLQQNVTRPLNESVSHGDSGFTDYGIDEGTLWSVFWLFCRMI
eukprot:TRINITY_DN2506_c0_g1_i2.p1 TRINITY_DN2506_c0_g1~~TRINITY_DN2506_c0_g1_i2.p1  ORF type:complete len:437 (-),score=118.56 TRINITY_DN2506_c0_g1_i2:51-1361(-)